MTKVAQILVLSFFSCAFANAQTLTDPELEYLNKQIRFYNETIHRMVIVFQIFEEYNRVVTDHVDLPSHTGLINTSTHLPENIFADNDLVVSGDSPISIYKELQDDPLKNSFPINTSRILGQVRSTINFLTRDRRMLDATIATKDMERFSNIQSVYEELEEALDHYDKIRNHGKTLEKILLSHYHEIQLEEPKKQVYTALIELNYDIKKMVRQLRNENQSGVINGISKLEKELNWVKTCINQLSSQNEKNELFGAIDSIEKIIEDLRSYLSSESIPPKYEPYGKNYYYHNYSILVKINQYGTGYVWKLEQFFRKNNWNVINFLEEPHFLKIVYPERIPLEIMTNKSIEPETNIRDLIESELPPIDDLVVEKVEENSPEEMTAEPEEEKPISIVHQETIVVDTSFITLRLQDHLKKDGDRVSISVNGEWVYKQISLERTTRKIELEVKPNSQNIVIIRADNVGWQPPNTISIICSNTRDADRVFIKKDLTYYEAIELKFVN